MYGILSLNCFYSVAICLRFLVSVPVDKILWLVGDWACDGCEMVCLHKASPSQGQ